MNMPFWFSNLAFWSVQVTLLVLVAVYLPKMLKIRQPGVLLAYWRAVLGISLVLPFVQPWHRLQNVGAIAFAPDFGGNSRNVDAVATPAPVVTHWELPSVQVIAMTVGIVILAGIAVRLAILTLGLLKLRQFRRASSPISELADCAAVLEEMRARVGTRAEFRLSADVDSPVTFGFAAPVVLLPERFPSMYARFQAAIACHELMHVRRRDWAHHLSEEIIRTALWFHPAIAWLISRVRLAREQVVDLEVVRLTKAPKPYVEALLEIMSSRARFAAIPAPPFLVERQLAERVALMLKEVRMSRTRLIASMTVIACSLALTVMLAVWTFPLKAAPIPAQNPPQSGVIQGIPGGVNGGVITGVSGGVPGGIGADGSAQGFNGEVIKSVVSGAKSDRSSLILALTDPVTGAEVGTFTGNAGNFVVHLTDKIAVGASLKLKFTDPVTGKDIGTFTREAGLINVHITDPPSPTSQPAQKLQADEPVADGSILWPSTVKRGPMVRQVRGLGTLVRADDSKGLIAMVQVPESMASEVQLHQIAEVDTRKGIVKGLVNSISPAPSNGMIAVTIRLTTAIPEGVGADSSVDGTIDIDILENILSVGRPVHGDQNSEMSLFKVVDDGNEAVRINVKFGRISVNQIEILDGLKAGDVIILSDMSNYKVDRIRIVPALVDR